MRVENFRWLQGEHLIKYYESAGGYLRFCRECRSPITTGRDRTGSAPPSSPRNVSIRHRVGHSGRSTDAAGMPRLRRQQGAAVRDHRFGVFRGITDDFDCGESSGPGAREAPPGVAPSHVGPPQAASRFQRARRVSSAESVIMIPIRAWGATARKVARTASSAATREDGRVCCSGSLNRRAIAANISKLLRSLNKPPDRLRPRLQDGARRYRVEAEGFRLPFRPLA